MRNLRARGAFVRAGLASAAAAAWQRPARAADFTYRIGTGEPVESPLALAAGAFAAEVKRESAGRLEFRVFPNGVLGGSSAMLEQVRLGALQVVLTGGDILSSIIPVAGIERVGFAFVNTAAGIAALDGELGAYVRKDFPAKGFAVLPNFWVAGHRQITTSTHPIRSADDLAGVRIRIPASAITGDLFKTLGASPVSIVAGEMYTALQTHVVDAMEGTYANIIGYRTFEVQKYISVTNHEWNGFWFTMNVDAWKELPADLQGIVERNAARFARSETREAELLNAASADKLKRLGLRMNAADTGTFRNRLGDYYARWKREFGPAAWTLLEKYVGKLG